jgi:hypothetical protein
VSSSSDVKPSEISRQQIAQRVANNAESERAALREKALEKDRKSQEKRKKMVTDRERQRSKQKPMTEEQQKKIRGELRDHSKSRGTARYQPIPSPGPTPTNSQDPIKEPGYRGPDISRVPTKPRKPGQY